MVLAGWYDTHSNQDQNSTFTAELSGASNLLSNLASFLVSFYVSVVLTRWWSVREAFGGVQGGVRNLLMLVAAHTADNDEANEVRSRLRRYAVLIHALCIKSERGETDLSDLCTYGLIAPAEESLLNATHQREYMVTTWMARLVAAAADAGLVSQPLASLPLLQTAISSLRGSVGLTGMFRCSQLPFPYIHLITVCAAYCVL